MKPPGEIHTRNAATKLVVFNGMRYCKAGNASPTDIDGCVELNDALFIYFDLKAQGKELERGQELCFKRTVNRIQKSGAPAYLIVAEHYLAEHYVSCGGDILAKNCPVKKVYHKGRWEMPPEQMPLKQYIDTLLIKHGLSRYIYCPKPTTIVPDVPREKKWEDNLWGTA